VSDSEIVVLRNPGTGNDFATSIGMPADRYAAADGIADALREGRTRLLDLARITCPDGCVRWYGAVLAAGFDAIVRICPDADATDGLLDMVWAEPVSRATLIRVKPRVYRGTHLSHPKVHSLRARGITLAAEGIVCYADGERISPLPVAVTAVCGAVRILS
jgi:diacylglycerol kinase (ATP)